MTKAGAPRATVCPSASRTAATTPPREARIGSVPCPGTSTNGLEMVSGSCDDERGDHGDHEHDEEQPREAAGGPVGRLALEERALVGHGAQSPSCWLTR